ncbi:MAG TPA: alginate biosynthesis protein AlgM [Oceanospirillales bacterium]|nr:alginate biosynthesis protein AlgM [Oceanospirillales bacterium]|tara:strand:+ start:1846 stop:2325 length:480 start_codon:yes stop_codon:yes gene_type:complete
MIEEQVVVTSIDVDGVWVEGVQQSACGSCSAKAGCGKHAMSQLGRKVSLWLPNVDLEIGQQVVVGLPEGAILRSTLALYGIPLIFLLSGAIVGNAIFGELGSIVFSVFFMMIGFKIARSRADKNKQNWQPRFIRVCSSSLTDFEQVLKPINIEANEASK